MTQNRNNNGQTDNPGQQPTTIAGMLAAAVDMEEQIAGGVYQEYLDRDNWPDNLEPDIFETIRGYLTTLLDDTKKHKRIITALMREYGNDRQT